MQVDLSGRSAFVSGGNSGIGRAISVLLARSGAEVALTYFSSQAEDTAAEIRSLGCKAHSFRMDARDSGEVNRVVEKAAQDLGGHIDILVCNTGALVQRSPIEGMSDDLWHSVLEVNLSSAFYCARAVIPFMNQGWGRIVNISSVSAYTGGGDGGTAYSAAKAGLFGLTRGLSKELTTRGITVNSIAPGIVLKTSFHSTYSDEVTLQKRISQIPIKRGGDPEEIAGAVLYLSSDLASYMTGSVLDINGGMVFR